MTILDTYEAAMENELEETVLKFAGVYPHRSCRALFSLLSRSLCSFFLCPPINSPSPCPTTAPFSPSQAPTRSTRPLTARVTRHQHGRQPVVTHARALLTSAGRPTSPRL